MSALFYSDDAATRIAKYLHVKQTMEMEGATSKLLEEARSYAVEALQAILSDNEETTGLAAMREVVNKSRGQA